MPSRRRRDADGSIDSFPTCVQQACELSLADGCARNHTLNLLTHHEQAAADTPPGRRRRTAGNRLLWLAGHRLVCGMLDPGAAASAARPALPGRTVAPLTSVELKPMPGGIRAALPLAQRSQPGLPDADATRAWLLAVARIHPGLLDKAGDGDDACASTGWPVPHRIRWRAAHPPPSADAGPARSTRAASGAHSRVRLRVPARPLAAGLPATAALRLTLNARHGVAVPTSK